MVGSSGAAAEAPKTAAEMEGATTEELGKGGGIITGRACPIHERRQSGDAQFHGVRLDCTGMEYIVYMEWTGASIALARV